MKKSLFAIAAVTAFAGAAQAQSSVTVYGILDVGFNGTSARVPAATTTVQGTGPATVKTNTSRFGESAESSSRIGFRGTEDLGGGTSAFFTLELGVSPQSAVSPLGNNRQTFVGLAQKGVGQASIGTQYTALWMNALNPTDPGAGNNVAGSIIRPVGVTASNDGQGAASTAVTILTTNSLYLQSQRMAGFRLGANYIQSGQDDTQRMSNLIAETTTRLGVASAVVGGQNNFTGYSLSADYTWKKLLVTAGYTQLKQQQSLNTTETITTISANPVTLGSTTNTKDVQMFAGAVYDFGVLKAYLNYVNRKITNDTNSNEYLSRTGQQIGVRSFITPKIEGWASGGTGRYQAFGVSEPTANLTAYQLGANYYLSKRTNLYGIFGHSQTSSVQGGTTTGANAGAAISGYAVGVRHTF